MSEDVIELETRSTACLPVVNWLAGVRGHVWFGLFRHDKDNISLGRIGDTDSTS